MMDKEDQFEYEKINFNLSDYFERAYTKEPDELSGILVLPSPNWRGTSDSVYLPETFNFLKWAKNVQKIEPRISLAEVENTKVADLRSYDIWLPIVYLFSDVSLQIYLGIVSSYVYDKLKGALQNEDQKIDIEAYVEDKKKGQIKKFSYHGSYKGFKEVAEKININELLDD